MTTRLLVALLTVAVFLAGFAARVLTEPAQPVPPAPTALTKELSQAGQAPGDKNAQNPLDRAKLVAEIHKLRPQIEAYSAQIGEIEAEFDREVLKILDPAQREKLAANRRKNAERDAKKLSDRTPLSDRDIQMAQERPLTSLYWMVTVTPRLENMTREYSLTETQQTNVRSLLVLRRTKYIALFDSTPHPSIRLSRLAPIIERLTAPAKQQE
jgi:Spy/CpxP family protein refolding chaperone